MCQLRWVTGLGSEQAEVDATLADQIKHIGVLSEETFKFQVWVALVELDQKRLVLAGLVGV
ncbi:hypothetical protein D3C78_1918360 [compost metagenome]